MSTDGPKSHRKSLNAGFRPYPQLTPEWAAYSADYRDSKAQIYDRQRGRTAFQNARADVKDQFKPLRSALSRQQWRETKDFEKKERRVRGKLENALEAISHAKSLGRDSSKGFAAMAFNFLISKKARADALDKLHKALWRNLNAGQNAQIGAAIQKIKNDQQAAAKSHRTNFASRRQLLKDTQAAERSSLQSKWRDRKLERGRAFELLRKTADIKSRAKAPSRGETRAEFNRAARVKRKRKGRTRKRDPE